MPLHTKTLYLMRHGSAERGDAYHDFSRKLNQCGVREVLKQVEKFKAPDGIRPDCIISSTAVRTKETVELVAKLFTGVPVFYKEALYLAPSHRLLEIIQQTDDIFHRILMIAHNPGLEQITALIAKKQVFHPATCVDIRLNLKHWKEVTTESGAIQKIF